MKKTLFVLTICCNSVFAQQKTTLKDSVLLSVLNNFIDEAKLEEREYKIVKVILTCFKKDLKIKSIDTTRIGAIKGLEIDTEYDETYSFSLEYVANTKAVQIETVTYYFTHRKIPILVVTGFENLVRIKEDKRELSRLIEKSSNPNVIASPIIWFVDVHNRKVMIKKLSD